MDFSLRTATLDDVDVLDAHPPQRGASCEHAADVSNANNTYLIAVANGAVVAHGFIRWTGFMTKVFAAAFPDCAVINSLCVWPQSMHRQGIGTAMVAEFESLARLRAVKRVGLGVYVDNVGARAFYQTLGYDYWDGGWVLDDDNVNHPDGGTVMTKTLP